MIELIFANVGAGKTTYASMRIQKEYKKMLKGKSKYKYIYCNAPIKNSILLDIRKTLEVFAIEQSLIVIDEASIEYNNRLMKIGFNEIQYFKLHRHYNSDIIVISQSYEDIDITLRRMYQKMYLLRNMYICNLTMIKEIKNYITIDENEQIIEGYKYKFFPKFFRRKKYYQYFDSFWRPDNVPIYKNNKDIEVKKIESGKFKNIKKIKRNDKNND